MQTATPPRFSHVAAADGETYAIIGESLTFKLTNATTGGAFTVVELESLPGGGPPLHTHPSSEIFTILEGEFEFTCVEDGVSTTIRARPGDTVFIPGHAPHAYTVCGETPGRTMLVFTPGDEMERFFVEAGQLVTPGEPFAPLPPDFPAIMAAGARQGLAFVLPGPGEG